MKLLLAFLLAVVVPAASFAEGADDFSPAVSLDDALDLARRYVREQKIETSDYYLTSVALKSTDGGKSRHWDAQWMTRSGAAKGDWFIIRVGMDRSCSRIAGK